MSQDKSPNNESGNQSADDSARTAATRKDSVIAQPLDALRQPTASSKDSRAPEAASGMKAKPSAGSAKSSPASSSTTPPPTKKPTSAASAMSTNKQDKTSQQRGVWAAIFLGLVLLIAALAAGLWWQQQQFKTVAREVATRLQQSDQQLTAAAQKADQALSLASAQREVVDQLSRELAVTSNELNALQQAWQTANQGLDQTLMLNDLKRLIGMADQELTLFGNVNSAVSILSSVNAMLKAQPAAPLKNLQQAVNTDLARLRAVPQVDVADLSARLDSLIHLTGQAPLLSPEGQITTLEQPTPSSAVNPPSTVEPTEPSDSAAADQPWWQEATDTVTSTVGQWSSQASAVLLREFADVMSIRRADDPQALLLSEEQAIQLRANVRGMLLSAQLALMTRQTDIWRSELTQVQSLINTRYDKQALDTKAALKLLSELLKAPVAADVPQINETLGALASAQRSLSIPAESDAGVKPNGQGS